MTRSSSRRDVASASAVTKRKKSATTPLDSRRSKRGKPSTTTSEVSDVTPRRSRYFEKNNLENTSDLDSEASGEVSQEDDAIQIRTLNTSSRKSSKKGEELWRPGIKTGLGPGKEVFVELPKAREAGSIPYMKTTIHPNTLLFLGDLRNNNDREWLKVHDADYRTSQNDFNSFIEHLTEKIIEKDETIPELPVKDIIFRIYRDIRFSKDPTPYKIYFSAAWSRTGRKGPYAAYYLQIQPGQTFVGGGLWMPEARSLEFLRRDVDRKPHKLKQVLLEARLRKEFLGGVGKDEKKAVKAFAAHNSDTALKTKPKGYALENENIELLRLRSYTVGKRLRDEEIVGPDALDRIAELIGILTPFITYLNSVVMPDDDGSEDSSDENNGAGGAD
ncbi:hypothetical protein L228DRAFT_249779 [Xylona heveae TC161]|uniref:Uncharacterized protein n=1 Tax=Xylona heveae (strain CBS 132557 / TC161) TaxID=1328760 RepID=A0A165FG35_XYLHT|nr:hypothetical protein L228DRAFT_249779 [Xylona heveae TC161]KZF20935.1 hypothetical protein L228DRAFT_249779 [Xylona heveae TC161]